MRTSHLAHMAGNYIKDAFKGSIQSYERIGKYTDADGNELDILVIHLSREEFSRACAHHATQLHRLVSERRSAVACRETRH